MLFRSANNPFFIVAVLGGEFLYNIIKGQSRSLEKLKEQIKTEAVRKLAENADKQAADMADGIKAKMKDIAKQIIGSVSKELNDIENQVQAIIEEKQQGEQEVEKRRRELAQCEAKVHELNTKLDTLIFTLVGA